jgi:membrane-bound inhibitor of C-type lysozyme
MPVNQGTLKHQLSEDSERMNLTNTASSLRLAVVLISAFLVAGCVAKQDPVTMTEPASSKSAAVDSAFDMDSWQTIIGDDCRSFFDGCNNCFREPGKMAACTRKACAVYQQPRCLDDEAGAASAPAAKRLDYACDGNNSFSVSYREYVQDDQRLRLKDSEIMFSDDQTRTAYRLQRERSASGEKYINAEGFEFFAKGDEALVRQQGTSLYANCGIKSWSPVPG